MEFTGERVVPGKVEPDLWNEHLSRYYFAQPLMAHKYVLDLGCGTGYGSSVLASVARVAVGVDISEEAISFARQNYSAANLSFFVADCSRLSLASDSLDGIVCFEVIEHLEKQTSLLEESHRVLKADGLLMISTPNRVFYTEERNDLNPFHTHEFDFEEFASCLKNYFKKVEVYYQNHAYSIFIGDPRSSHPVSARLAETQESLESTSNFFVAICSKSEQNWPHPKSLVYLPSTGNLLREKEQRITQLESKIVQLDGRILNFQKEYDERTQWCLKLDRLIKNRDATILDLQNQLEGRTAWAHRLSQEITQKDAQILKLQKEYDERTEWALSLNEKLEKIKQSNVFRFSKALGLVPKF